MLVPPGLPPLGPAGRPSLALLPLPITGEEGASFAAPSGVQGRDTCAPRRSLAAHGAVAARTQLELAPPAQLVARTR